MNLFITWQNILSGMGKRRMKMGRVYLIILVLFLSAAACLFSHAGPCEGPRFLDHHALSKNEHVVGPLVLTESRKDFETEVSLQTGKERMACVFRPGMNSCMPASQEAR